jgi:hypothetical protein
MNGLKPELKTIVMTKEPKHVEELRHCATLAEKVISSNTVNTISQTVLEEIQTLKDQLKSINIVQDVQWFLIQVLTHSWLQPAICHQIYFCL